MSANKKRPGGVALNLLNSLFILGSVLLLAYFGYTYANPYHPLNPLQPPTPAAELQPAAPEEPTAALVEQEAPQQINTPTQSLLAETSIPLPTQTPIPFPTATPVVINTPMDTSTIEPRQKFVAQKGTPSYLPYSGGCSGLYIAGHITDIDLNPVMLMTVRAAGTLGGEEIFIEVLSGSNPNYTISGWEIKLSDTLIDSTGEIILSLYQQGGWEPVSEEVLVDTFNDCSRNLAVVNFVQE
ncbi:MAG: hypothetical protein JW757_13005 [Anaerolineales bacterium]|nr:hypothetical protein [Anaerolineales bacterium]